MYRPITRLLLTIFASLLLSACGSRAASGAPPTSVPPTSAPPTSAPPSPTMAPAPPTATPNIVTSVNVRGVPFQLAIGQTAALTPGLTLTFVNVATDSRCPSNVACAWGGVADILLDVTQTGQLAPPLKLRLYGTGRKLTAEASGQAAGYTVTFTALDPYPNMTTPTRANDYVATLIVTPADAQPAPGDPATPQPTPAAFARVDLGSARGFIVPAPDAQGVGERTDTYWTPTEADMRAMETRLAEYLRTAARPRSPELWQKQATYTRQYVGLVRQEHKLIYTSFFCSTAHMNDLDRYTVGVMDGGDCYFQTTYDVERQTFVDVQVNGNA